MNRVLAQLHSIDPTLVGLADSCDLFVADGMYIVYRQVF